MFIYKYEQLKGRIPYDEVDINKCPIFKKNLMHLGQLKLLMSEILFLTKITNQIRKNKSNLGHKVIKKVVYVGAAEGYHTAYLADMFPDFKFDLWDQREFDIKDRPNITLFNRLFLDSDADNYVAEGSNIVFISDIRNLDVGVAQRSGDMVQYNMIINSDNEKQMKWCQIINPIAAYLKFRPPYNPGKTSYLDGTIYLQSYSPLSTETRLYTTNYDKMVEYDNTEFDEKLAYFNCYDRANVNKLTRWKDIMQKNKIEYNWDNIYALYVIAYYLKNIQNITTDDAVITEFNKIIKFLARRYGRKYTIIYQGH